MPPTSLPLVPEARTALVKVPVTPAEKTHLSALAASQGRSLSELVRLALPLEDPSQDSNPFANVEPLDIAVTMRDGAA